jgi:hypothetical protein
MEKHMDNTSLSDTRAQLTSKDTQIAADLILREAPSVLAGELSDAPTEPEKLVWKLSILRVLDHAELASAAVVAGELATELRALGVPAAMLRTSAAVRELKIKRDDAQATNALLYAIARRARMLDRTNVVLPSSASDAEILAKLGKFEPCSQQLSRLLSQRVDLAAHYASQALVASGAQVEPRLRALEVADTVRAWLAGGRNWGLFRAVHARTLTRTQYVYAMSNIYQFVRHTTRLLARCIAHSATTEMRSHFIHHLNGEVNHELIIERDLQHLGEDVDYVRHHMSPNGPTQEFMAIQESMIGYYEDPILLMASPMAAEGVTAHLNQEFVDGLHDCMRAWGVAKPEKASKFFVSHMHTDGGEDGHWEMTVAFLSKCLLDEPKHQFFLRSMRSAMRGTARLYESFAEDIPTWTTSAEHLSSERDLHEIRA